MLIRDTQGRQWDVDCSGCSDEPPSFKGHPDNWHDGSPGYLDFEGASCDDDPDLKATSLEAFTEKTGLDGSDLMKAMVEEAAEARAEAKISAMEDRW